MSGTRRGFLRGMLSTGLAGAMSAIARPPAPRVVEVGESTVEVEATWADEWPPAAFPGKLVRCDEEPGYYTIGGVAALFGGQPATAETGISGFPVGREIEPADGLHVIEVGRDGPARYAVVRHQEG